MPEFRPVHDSRVQRRAARQRAAKLTEDLPPVVIRVVRVIAVYVHPLSDQRRPMAASAALATGREPIDSAAQQGELQLWHVTDERVHCPCAFAVDAFDPSFPPGRT